MMIVDKTSGFTLLGNNSLVYILKHSSVLENPSIRVSLYRRNYDTPYSLNYDLVDIKDFINYNYIDTTVDKEYIMLEKALSENNIFMSFKDNLKSATIYLEFPSVGATENIILADSLAEGATIIGNAAREPEIVELCRFLKVAGAKIFGEGTRRIRIVGQKKLCGVPWTVCGDRIVFFTFAMLVRSEERRVGKEC